MNIDSTNGITSESTGSIGKFLPKIANVQTAVALAATLSLAACGGSGSDTNTDISNTPETGGAIDGDVPETPIYQNPFAPEEETPEEETPEEETPEEETPEEETPEEETPEEETPDGEGTVGEQNPDLPEAGDQLSFLENIPATQNFQGSIVAVTANISPCEEGGFDFSQTGEGSLFLEGGGCFTVDTPDLDLTAYNLEGMSIIYKRGDVDPIFSDSIYTLLNDANTNVTAFGRDTTEIEVEGNLEIIKISKQYGNNLGSGELTVNIDFSI